jgi:hypothetical protein
MDQADRRVVAEPRVSSRKQPPCSLCHLARREGLLRLAERQGKSKVPAAIRGGMGIRQPGRPVRRLSVGEIRQMTVRVGQIAQIKLQPACSHFSRDSNGRMVMLILRPWPPFGQMPGAYTIWLATHCSGVLTGSVSIRRTARKSTRPCNGERACVARRIFHLERFK